MIWAADQKRQGESGILKMTGKLTTGKPHAWETIGANKIIRLE